MFIIEPISFDFTKKKIREFLKNYSIEQVKNGDHKSYVKLCKILNHVDKMGNKDFVEILETCK